MASVLAILLFLTAILALSPRIKMIAAERNPCNSLPNNPSSQQLEDAHYHCVNEQSRLLHRAPEASKDRCAGSYGAECTRYQSHDGHRCTVAVQSLSTIACFLRRVFQRIDIRSCIVDMMRGFHKNSPLDELEFKYLEQSREHYKMPMSDQASYSAAYSIWGRRSTMEDRFVLQENVPRKEIAYFAVFDGHGGEVSLPIMINGPLDKFAADYARDNLLTNLIKKIDERSPLGPPKRTSEMLAPRTPSPLNSKQISIDSIDEPDYAQLLNDAILSTDKDLMADPKKPNFAGSTALIALIARSRLFVANVGDSRGVMCDSEGKAVPLSVDHKPFQRSERLRVEAAGGTVTFAHGAWRVNGHVSLSRTLGNDLAEKEKRQLIADPEILTLELCRDKPRFLVLASDGLWDVLSNEEVVAFLGSRLREKYLGARSLAYYASLRGSGDNITVVVIDLRNRKWGCSRRSRRRGPRSPREQKPRRENKSRGIPVTLRNKLRLRHP